MLSPCVVFLGAWLNQTTWEINLFVLHRLHQATSLAEAAGVPDPQHQCDVRRKSQDFDTCTAVLLLALPRRRSARLQWTPCWSLYVGPERGEYIEPCGTALPTWGQKHLDVEYNFFRSWTWVNRLFSHLSLWSLSVFGLFLSLLVFFLSPLGGGNGGGASTRVQGGGGRGRGGGGSERGDGEDPWTKYESPRGDRRSAASG